VKKLVDGVFQEHFEFLHWLHDYAHKTYPDAVRKYHGFARRQQVLQSGHSPMSIRELDNANMNLVPSYAVRPWFTDLHKLYHHALRPVAC
jgi:hypothetical protein